MMLDEKLKEQLATYLERVTEPLVLVASLDDSSVAAEMRALLEELAAVSDKITWRLDSDSASPARRPSFSIQRAGDATPRVRFAAIPLGLEFSSLVLALLQVGGHPPKLDADLVQQIQALQGNFHFETVMSLSCHNCPDVVQALNTMAVLNPRISHVVIDGALFQEEVEQRQVMAVPTVFLNGQVFAQGRMGIEEIVAKLDEGAQAKDAAKLSARAPYDVLIVGGGPAGCAAALYAARKGIRTAVVAQRMGGQLLDTLAIENYAAMLEVQGPQFAAAMEQQLKRYGVDIINAQQAQTLVPRAKSGDWIQLQLASGGVLRARAVILATGARWRELNVPGEQLYRNHGVAYCAHCDGPLFKGKRVAVVGGGNSGVEAAIDLAGVVEHVTLLEFSQELRADKVLVQKLQSLGNVEILMQAQTSEIVGDGKHVTGLSYLSRANGQQQHVVLEGVFIQIGLVPNTEWLKGVLELSSHGEIVVDARGQTSVPGVFAAGDATIVAFKQIGIAAGDGAKAALSAFDYLIRSAPVSNA